MSRARWTPPEDALLSLVYPSGRLPAARTALPHRSSHAIYRRVFRLGISQHGHWTAAECDRLRLLWGDGGNIYTIARKLGRPAGGTFEKACDLGLPIGTPQGFERMTHAARRAGYDISTLTMILRWAGKPRHPALSHPHGQRRQRGHVVDPIDVDDAVAAWNETESVRRAAQRAHVDYRTLVRGLDAIGIHMPGGRRMLRVTDMQVQAALATRRAQTKVCEVEA